MMSVELLKIIGMVTMVLDHMGAVNLFGDMSLQMRYVGRLAFPIYAYLMATGFRCTSNPFKHMVTLGIFALISEVPYDLVHGALYYPASQNVLWTFFFATLTMFCIQNFGSFSGILLSTAVGVASYLGLEYFNTDYSIYGFSLVLFIYALEEGFSLNQNRAEIIQNLKKENNYNDEVAFSWISSAEYRQICWILLLNFAFIFYFVFRVQPALEVDLFGFTFSAQLFGMFSLFPIGLYIFSGQKKSLSGSKAKIFKWFSYGFYPAHLLIIWFMI